MPPHRSAHRSRTAGRERTCRQWRLPARAASWHRTRAGFADPHHLGGASHQRDVPRIKTIGGYRQDPLPWHPNGLAIDVMIPDYHTPEGIELGNQIAGFALANAKRWGVLHVIWRQGFYPGIGAPSWTADYGNETANHYDHVHIATDGGDTRPGARRTSSGR